MFFSCQGSILMFRPRDARGNSFCLVSVGFFSLVIRFAGAPAETAASGENNLIDLALSKGGQFFDQVVF